MSRISLRGAVVSLAVGAALLASAGPASAVLYNGHAGLRSAVYQHNQTDYEYLSTSGVTDGTSNTLQFALAGRSGG